MSRFALLSALALALLLAVAALETAAAAGSSGFPAGGHFNCPRYCPR